MARRPSIETKIKRGQGQGEGADYKPWITVNEVNSLGTASVIPDWKTGRGVHCLSQAEAMWYYILRWDDNNIDIREQFPLWDDDHTNAETKTIAERLGVRHPGGEGWIMTTDFLVTEADGRYHAYSVKPGRNLSERTMQKLAIEKIFWMSRGVPFDLVFKEDANPVLAANLHIVMEYYDPASVFDEYSVIKHLIAVKGFEADLEHEILTVEALKKIEEGNYGRIGIRN